MGRRCGGFPVVAGEPDHSDRRRLAGDLCAARRALRELRPPADHPCRPAFSRRRRAAHALGCSIWTISIIAMIGILMLIGIVKKNAIMMIDFALDAQREQGMSPQRGDPHRLPAALPPDHDDHACRDHGCAAHRARPRRRRRTAPAAGPGRGRGPGLLAGHHPA
jgi:hypothetical protein